MKIIMIKSNCGLCERNDLLLGHEFTTTHIQNAFFSLTKNLFHKEFVDKIQLCIICTHKIDLSSQIVREYEETCNRNNTLNAKKCFFCEDKAVHLIDFNENPIEAENKINVFLNSVNVNRNYNDLKSCIRCLYNLETWTEMRNKLFLKLNLLDVQTPTRNDKTRLNHIPFKTPEAKTTSDVMPIKASIRRRLRKNVHKLQKVMTTSTPDKNGNTSNVSTNSGVFTTPSKTTTKRSHKAAVSKDNQKLCWSKYLSEKLKHLQTVNKIVQNEEVVFNTTNIENEDKLFNTLPFVEILITSQISKDRILRKVVSNVADGDDSKNDKVLAKTPTRKSNLSKDGPKRQRKPNKKNRFKFKMPTKKSSLSLINAVPTVQSEPEEDELDEPVLVISSESESEKDFICEICDKNFRVKCDYLAHKLKHEKMEEIIINVLRHNLPIQLKVTELSPKRNMKEITSPENINRLLTKWIGEHAVKLYEAADKSINEEIEEMIEEETVNLEADASEEANGNQIEQSRDSNKSNAVDESNEKENEEMDVDTTENLKDMAEENENDEVETNNKSEIIDKSDKDSEENKIDSADADEVQEEEGAGTEAGAETETKGQAVDEDIENIAIPILNSDDEVQCISNDELNNDKETESSNKEEPCTTEKSLHENSEEQKTDSSNMEGNNRDNTSIKEAEATESSLENKHDNENESTSPNIKEHSFSTSDDKLKSNKNDKVIEKSNDNIAGCKDTNITNTKKDGKNDNFDEFSNSDNVSPPVMTCEDLLNILETNIDSEETGGNNLTDPSKRKRETDYEDDTTPKRKKVRFADEKEVYSPDQDGVMLEKVVENIYSVPENVEVEDKES